MLFHQLHGPAKNMAQIPEAIQQYNTAEAEWGKPEVMLASVKNSASPRQKEVIYKNTYILIPYI